MQDIKTAEKKELLVDIETNFFDDKRIYLDP